MSAIHPALRGILLILCAVFLFGAMDATAKSLATKYPVPMLVWARYSVHCLLMFVFLLPTHGKRLWHTRRPMLQIVRALLLLAITGLTITAFRVLPLTVATAIAFLAPLLVGILSGPILGEKTGRTETIALIVGLVGVLLIARPGGDTPLGGVMLALLGALCYTAYQLLTRLLAPHESAVTMLFFTALMGMLVTTATLPWTWQALSPGPFDAALIVLLGILGGSGHYLLILAFRHAPATTLAPFLYVQMVWEGLFDFLVFQHVPDAPTWAGIGLIALAGLGVALKTKFSPASRLAVDRAN
ncbi:MAG TPA: DMT family transporter [Rhodocyclaceae bacterium]|nr:DMT family transporter [Rhodocyclaceae bacterium]